MRLPIRNHHGVSTSADRVNRHDAPRRCPSGCPTSRPAPVRIPPVVRPAATDPSQWLDESRTGPSPPAAGAAAAHLLERRFAHCSEWIIDRRSDRWSPRLLLYALMLTRDICSDNPRVGLLVAGRLRPASTDNRRSGAQGATRCRRRKRPPLPGRRKGCRGPPTCREVHAGAPGSAPTRAAAVTNCHSRALLAAVAGVCCLPTTASPCGQPGRAVTAPRLSTRPAEWRSAARRRDGPADGPLG